MRISRPKIPRMAAGRCTRPAQEKFTKPHDRSGSDRFLLLAEHGRAWQSMAEHGREPRGFVLCTIEIVVQLSGFSPCPSFSTVLYMYIFSRGGHPHGAKRRRQLPAQAENSPCTVLSWS